MGASEYVRSMRTRVGHDPLHLPSVAAMIRDERGRVLLVRNRDTGRWQTVGGAIDPGESPREAAVREAREETGYEVEPARIVGVYGGPEFRLTYPNGDVCDYVAIVFECRAIGGAPRPDHDEVDALRWFGEDEALALPLEPHTRRIVADVFAGGPTRF